MWNVVLKLFICTLVVDVGIVYEFHKVYEILHLPQPSKATLVFKRKKEKITPEGETPALFAFESYLTGILTSLDSSGSWGKYHMF